MSTIADTFALAWQYHQAGNVHQAEQLYRQVIQADPGHADGWCFLGAVCQAQGRLAEAEVSYRRALHLLPDHPSAPNCLGIVLAQQGKLEDSARVFDSLYKSQPDDPQVLNNFGLVKYKQEKLSEALPMYRRALELRPDFGDAHNNLANVLGDLGHSAEALDHFNRALALKPDFPECRFNRANLLLLCGQFTEGWKEYESRWQQPGFTLPPYRQPRWDGSPLGGKTILLWAEQGLGDTLQAIRYAGLVKQRGGRVIVATQPQLVRLLEGCAGIDQVVSKDGPPPSFDVYSPLLSLPGLFGTTLANLPAAVPYLSADPALVRRWHGQLGNDAAVQVGIVWRGNPVHRHDHRRSIPLLQFARLAEVPGIRLISLQKGKGTEELGSLASRFSVLDLSNRLEDFTDTGAVVKNLELVICCDTAVAHLAGALAVPVWVALPRVPDWRWLEGREDSPWYPTMRLFRQTRHGQWQDVFEQIAEEVKKLSPLSACGERGRG